MGGSKGFELGRLTGLGVFLGATAILLCVAGGCGKQMTRLEENQIKLQAMVAANARELATISSQIHTGQGRLTDGIQSLDSKAQGIATEVQTVRTDQRQLQETVVSGHQELDARATQIQEAQHALQVRVAQVQDVTQRTASDLTSLSQQHAGLQQTVQANQREINGHMGVVVVNQQGLQAGVTRLQQADEGLARDIASVTARQDALTAAIQDNDKRETERLTSLAAGHDRLSAEVLNVRTAVQSVATGVTGVADQQATLHTAVQTGTQALSDKLTILERNQHDNQAGIDRVFSAVNQTAATISAMAAAQTAMQESLDGNHEQVVGRLTSLAESQRSLQTGIDTLNGKADQAATESTAAASSLQETLRVSREVVTGQMAASLQNQQAIQTSVQDLSNKADNLATNLTAVSAEQASAREASKTRHDEIVTAMAGLSEGHQAIRNGIDQVNSKADAAAMELSAAAQRQSVLQQGLADGQRGLRSQLDTLTAVTNQTALSMLTLNNGQATFQQAMQTGMGDLHARADQTAEEVRGMAEQQIAFQNGIRTSHESLATQTAAITEGQRALQVDVGRTAKVIDRAYADLTAVAIAQDTLQTTLANHSDSLNARVARIEDNQKMAGENLEILTATAGQAAIDVLDLANGQANLRRSIQAGDEAVIQQTAALAEGQKALNNQLDVLTATTGQTAIDVLAMGNDQAKLAQTVQTGLAGVREQTSRVADHQTQMQDSLDILTATGGQTALDIIAMAGRQDDVHEALLSHRESTDGRMAALADVQRKMQGSLDTMTAATDQTVRSLTTLDESHARVEQAAQASRLEIAGKLATIAQDQQNWLQRLDAAQAKIQTMADGIAALDQHLVKLQGALQTGLQDATALAGANGQQRQQFEGRIAQDVQTLIEAISQLRQAQTVLQEQMTQVQKNTQSQTEAIKATIEQVKQPPAEVKVSDAVNETAKPVVVEGGE